MTTKEGAESTFHCDWCKEVHSDPSSGSGERERRRAAGETRWVLSGWEDAYGKSNLTHFPHQIQTSTSPKRGSNAISASC